MNLIWKLLRRDWRGGQLSLVATAITLSVAIIAGVALLADRVERGLVREMGSFLAADLVVRSGVVIPNQYRQEAGELGLDTAETAEFSSMIYSGDRNHLASVKAVSDAYPLRGQLIVSEQPFSSDSGANETLINAPAPGKVWIEERLFPLLDVAPGDEIELGDINLEVEKVLLQEPDRSAGLSLVGARVLMNQADLEASGLIQPGSRVEYQLLLRGEASTITEYETWAEANVSVHERIRRPERAEQRVTRTVERGRSYLLLAGTVGLLLAGIAQALASFRYAQRHIGEAALIKSWGASKQEVRRLYIGQLALLGVMTTAVGLLLGWGLHLMLLTSVREFLPVELPSPGLAPFLVAVGSGMLCLAGFTLPSLWHLPNISPMRVLRRDIESSPLSGARRAAWGVATLVLLLSFYAADIELVSGFLAGLAAILLILGLIAYLVLYPLGKSFGNWYGSYWRLAIANLLRRPGQTNLQLVAFASGIMLLLVMVLMRTSLLDEWRLQIPEDAPNHFLINVAESELPDINSQLEARDLDTAGWFPMVRGRLTHLNDEDITERRGVEGLRRELNLTWADTMPSDNEVLAGQWWPELNIERPKVSMEQEMASELGVQLGDRLRFSIGGLELEAEVSSFRSLNWDSMNPNFYMIFSPGSLDDFSPTWMTSLNIPVEDRVVISSILRAHPTVLALSLDAVLDRIRGVINQATQGLEIIFSLVLICGLLVFYAAIASSFEERAQEVAILRTLGSGKWLILGAVAAEFALLGALSGLVAAIAADLTILVLQVFVFELPVRLHLWMWLLSPALAAAVIGILGVMRTRRLVHTPPMQSLRALLD
jgi:putative ABC transport system permease protein